MLMTYVGNARPSDRFGTDGDGLIYLIFEMDGKKEAKAMKDYEPANNREASLILSTYDNKHTPLLRWQ